MFTPAKKLTTINGINFEITLGWVLLAATLTWSYNSTDAYDRYLSLFNTISPTEITSAFPATTLGMSVFAALLVTAIYTCVILHEIGHSLAAQHYGIAVKSIKLWVLGGVAELEAIPPTPQKEFHITIAGPLVTAALIPTFLALSALFYTLQLSVIYWFFLLLTLFNTGMLVLNLTPLFPLDGGRLLRSTLARRFSYLKSTRIATLFAQATAILGSIAALFSGQVGMLFLAAFIVIAARATHSSVKNKYNHDDEPILYFEDFLLYEQTFYIDATLSNSVASALASTIEEHGGCVVEPYDTPDMIITAHRPYNPNYFPTGLVNGVVTPLPHMTSVPVVPLSEILQHAEQHGSSVEPELTEFTATQNQLLPTPLSTID